MMARWFMVEPRFAQFKRRMKLYREQRVITARLWLWLPLLYRQPRWAVYEQKKQTHTTCCLLCRVFFGGLCAKIIIVQMQSKCGHEFAKRLAHYFIAYNWQQKKPCLYNGDGLGVIMNIKFFPCCVVQHQHSSIVRTIDAFKLYVSTQIYIEIYLSGCQAGIYATCKSCYTRSTRP